ncbi:hypothetical protein NBO_1230g0002 [Nosema bombycis CQ1]|uniref:Uncharacterized protein n=1 Tax=Nosema bombycis (strain CQ1 / CVCC 102059) TaxID=578461 RepID=R0KMP3_NOSB1|nr:hypothetical protein NBO_1230g0002 [Nosema bombycis CQ1]|eukprot:EOB11382.1 hypothetical protein NBO_1230g0002 [Nosema bombycis CQ1]
MSISKKDLRTFLNLLNENGTYQLQKKDESLYRKVIEYFTTKSKSKTDLNIQRIDNLKKKGNSYLADCLYGNKIKKMKLELGDKRLLSLLKDYEFKIKGNLKLINEMYSKLKEKGLTEEDYKGYKKIKEMYKYIQNGEKREGGSVVDKDDKSMEGSMVDISELIDQSLIVGESTVKVDQSVLVDHNMVDDIKDEYLEVDQSTVDQPPTSQPLSPNKKINFANLLIYSRFK